MGLAACHLSQSLRLTHIRKKASQGKLVGVYSPRGMTQVAFVTVESFEWASSNFIPFSPFSIEVEVRKGIGRAPVKGQTEIIRAYVPRDTSLFISFHRISSERPGLPDIERVGSRIKWFRLREALLYSYCRDLRFVLAFCGMLGFSLWWYLAPEPFSRGSPFALK